MANKVTRDGKRWYIWPNEDRTANQRFYSVTTILDGGIPKQHVLTRWAAKAVAEHAADDLDIVVAMSKKDDGREKVIDYLKAAPWRAKDKAAKLGSEVHEAIEAFQLGKPWPGFSKAAEPYMEQFVDCFSQQDPTIEQVEANVFNRARRYAGTLDGIGIFPKLAEMFHTEHPPRLLFDVKTGKGGKRGVYPETALQMAAYRHAEFIAGPDGSEIEMPWVDGAAVIHLQPGYWEIIPILTDETVFRSFLYAREVFIWQEEISRGVIGRSIRGEAEIKTLEEEESRLQVVEG